MPRPSHGDQFTAPNAVVANLDGTFSFQAEFLKEGVPDLLADYGWFGVANVNGGFSADCFCESFCTIQPGATITIHVEGQLTDPTQPGSASSSVSLCTPGHNYGALTAVYPYGTTGVGDPVLFEAIRFWNAPNPVRPHTTFHWSLPAPGSVELRIYDLAGRRVTTLVDEKQAAGEHRADLAAPLCSAGERVLPSALRSAGQSLPHRPHRLILEVPWSSYDSEPPYGRLWRLRRRRPLRQEPGR
jgi:hypothetical protein